MENFVLFYYTSEKETRSGSAETQGPLNFTFTACQGKFTLKSPVKQDLYEKQTHLPL